ncbi:hypothetical protein [Teredinibacter haidensis]|uniref:hypothetical protein n=1 Tax=Teredinibacter haidensis TaxID=2731755 RepID=UPI000948B7C9|nr:hypothetical protein [Teredinibacter haidensis]
MNYADIIQALDHASASDLYRLQRAIEHLIYESKRMIEIKKALLLGQMIDYYEASANRIEPAIVENIKETKAVMKNLRDGKRWQIPLCAINIRGTDTRIVQPEVEGLKKYELSIGDSVGFVDRAGMKKHGCVVRLNQKKATI